MIPDSTAFLPARFITLTALQTQRIHVWNSPSKAWLAEVQSPDRMMCERSDRDSSGPSHNTVTDSDWWSEEALLALRQWLRPAQRVLTVILQSVGYHILFFLWAGYRITRLNLLYFSAETFLYLYINVFILFYRLRYVTQCENTPCIVQWHAFEKKRLFREVLIGLIILIDLSPGDWLL